MAQTAASIIDALKRVYTDDTLQKQFEDGNGPLARIESMKANMIGELARVPLHKNRNLAGYTSVGTSGGNLNSAGQQAVDAADYTLVYHWLQIELDASAIAQADGGNARSVVSSKVLEIDGGVENVRHQALRQFVTNGDGIVAQLDTGGASTTWELIASPSGSAYGYDAIVRGWVGVGSFVSAGTTADVDSLTTSGANVTGIKDDPTDPDLITDVSITSTNGTHFVYIRNPNSATAASPEINGLRNMIHTTGAVGGLNPANAGEEFWAAAKRDTSTSVLSLDLMLSLSGQVRQRTGKPETDVWTGIKQGTNFYSLLQNQVRFTGDTATTAGSVQTTKWNGMTVEQFPDILDSDMYFLTLADLVRIGASFDTPTWASDIGGQSGNLHWAQGTTRFKDAVCLPLQVGLRRRNSHAAATGLTA